MVGENLGFWVTRQHGSCTYIDTAKDGKAAFVSNPTKVHYGAAMSPASALKEDKQTCFL